MKQDTGRGPHPPVAPPDGPQAEAGSRSETIASGAEAGLPSFDDWELDQQLSHIERVLRRSKARAKASGPGRRARVDSPHDAIPAWHPASRPAPAARDRDGTEGATAGGGFVWVVLSLGIMALVCGGVLLGWSVAAGRDDLWARGMPFVAGGQIALLVGLVLQLERLWRAGRRTALKLDQMDHQLHGLKSTTALLGTTHSSPAAAFYSHLAGGANPQLLLTDLKGQLDMLALKIGQEQ